MEEVRAAILAKLQSAITQALALGVACKKEGSCLRKPRKFMVRGELDTAVSEELTPLGKDLLGAEGPAGSCCVYHEHPPCLGQLFVW